MAVDRRCSSTDIRSAPSSSATTESTATSTATEGLRKPILHLGAPTVVGPLTLFPIWTDAPVPDVPVPLEPPATATIGELDSGPTVELLTAKNPTALPYVLLEGTIVDGGWQHRVLVHSVLVGAGAQLDLPVRCVEQGRWNGDIAQRLHHRRAPLGVRGATHGVRRPTEDSGFDRTVDQGDVWSRVAAYEQTYGTSPTSSLVEVLGRAQVTDQLRAAIPRPLLGQRGVLIGVAGHPALVEVFEHPDQLAQQWDALIDGLLASTLHVRRRTTSTRRARAFLDRLTGRSLTDLTPAGDGVLGEVADDLVSVRALDTRAGRTIHATALNVRHELVLAA